MGERRALADTSIAEMLDRVSRGVIVECALPVSPTMDELRQIEGGEVADVPALHADAPPRPDGAGSPAQEEPIL